MSLWNFFDVHVTLHRIKFLIIKPTRCTDFWNLFLEWNSTCFGQFLCSSSGVFHCTHSNGICYTGLLIAASRILLTAVSKPVWHIPSLCVQWKTPDDEQRNCPKHVEFHSKNKFEILVHQVGFIVRNLLLDPFCKDNRFICIHRQCLLVITFNILHWACCL